MYKRESRKRLEEAASKPNVGVILCFILALLAIVAIVLVAVLVPWNGGDHEHHHHHHDEHAGEDSWHDDPSSHDPPRHEEPNWPFFGIDQYNTANTNDLYRRSRLNRETAGDIVEQWRVDLLGRATARSAEYHSHVYVPTRDGFLYDLDKMTGAQNNLIYLRDITDDDDDYCDTTPAVTEDFVVLGMHERGGIIALNREDLTLAWYVQIHDYEFSTIRNSPIIRGDDIFVGVDSREQFIGQFIPDYPCCFFRGKVVRMNLYNGDIRWQWHTIEEALPRGPGNYSGVGIGGGNIVIDDEHHRLYVATGNPYSVPESVITCQTDFPTADCIDAGVYFNGVVALDTHHGHLIWYTRLTPFNGAILSCLFNHGDGISDFVGEDCPDPRSEHGDFKMMPTMIHDISGIVSDDEVLEDDHDMLLIGQKTGFVYALNPEDGSVYWEAFVAPNGEIGGFLWGGASDGRGYYLASANSAGEDDYLNTTGETIDGGKWIRLRVQDGAIDWERADPNLYSHDDSIRDSSAAVAPPALVNDLMIGASAAIPGTIVVLDKFTGSILNSFNTGASIVNGISVSGNCFYVGNGAVSIWHEDWVDDNDFIAYCVPDEL